MKGGVVSFLKNIINSGKLHDLHHNDSSAKRGGGGSGSNGLTTELTSSRRHSYLFITCVVLFYWTTSISMVFANKYLVGDAFQNIGDISIFVGWAQCLATVLVCVLVTIIRRCLLQHDVTLPPFERKLFFNLNYIIVVIVFTAMLVFNNLCLRYVGVAFFQVARSFTLLFVVGLSAVLLGQVVSRGTLCCCLLVVAGFILGVDQEQVAGSLSKIGVLYGVVTSFFIAMNGIMNKRLLNLVRHSNLSVVFYTNFGASFLFLPILLISGQLGVVWTYKVNDATFFLLLLLSGCLSFMIGYASSLQIDVTSPITHHISNNAKSVLQTILAVLVYAEHKTALWWMSNVLVIAGAFCYVRVKLQEDSALNKPPIALLLPAAMMPEKEMHSSVVNKLTVHIHHHHRSLSHPVKWTDMKSLHSLQYHPTSMSHDATNILPEELRQVTSS